MSHDLPAHELPAHELPGRAPEAFHDLDHAQARLDQHLVDHRAALDADPFWGPRLAEQEAGETRDTASAPAPTVAPAHGQLVTHLYALAAVNRARRTQGELGPSRLDPDLDAEYLRDQHARAQLGWAEIPWSVPEALPLALADALVWADEDQRAAEVVTKITDVYRDHWGILVDRDDLTVSVDPSFMPEYGQAWDEAVAAWAHETPVLDIVSASDMAPASKNAAQTVLEAWVGDGIDPQDPEGWLDARPDAYAKLTNDLAAAQMPAADRSKVQFLVDYLRGNTSELDLLDTPPLVDPGEEARGRIAQLLAGFADGRIPPDRMSEEIAVMTPEDQHTVREIGRAIVAGHKPDLRAWPGYANRDEILDELKNYATAAGNWSETARELLTYPADEAGIALIGIEDGLGLPRQAATRAKLQATVSSPEPSGLTPIERAQVAAVLIDIDAGLIRHRDQLPDLMWADERSRRHADEQQHARHTSQVVTRTETRIWELAHSTSPVEAGSGQEHDRLAATQTMAAALQGVAGGFGPMDRDEKRSYYTHSLNNLEKTLSHQGVTPTVTQAIHHEIHETAREAGHLGRQSADRAQQWATRTHAMVATRDDARTQRRAAEASVATDRTRNTRSPRTNPAARQHQQMHQARAATRRNLHSHAMDR